MEGWDIEVGAGSDVRAKRPKVVKVGPLHGDGHFRAVVIRQVFVVEAEVTLCEVKEGEKFHACGVCGKPPPPLDARAMRFIIRNHDGARICFPDVGNCRDERDCYPVTGWRRRKVGRENVLVCKACVAASNKALARAMKKRQRK